MNIGDIFNKKLDTWKLDVVSNNFATLQNTQYIDVIAKAVFNRDFSIESDLNTLTTGTLVTNGVKWNIYVTVTDDQQYNTIFVTNTLNTSVIISFYADTQDTFMHVQLVAKQLMQLIDVSELLKHNVEFHDKVYDVHDWTVSYSDKNVIKFIREKSFCNMVVNTDFNTLLRETIKCVSAPNVEVIADCVYRDARCDYVMYRIIEGRSVQYLQLLSRNNVQFISYSDKFYDIRTEFVEVA